MNKKVLGVIGGLGPLATAHFMELVTNMTDVATDQEHLEMVIYSVPSIPDRTRYILDNSQDDPYPKMQKTAEKLVAQGVDTIAVPCVTAHYFFDPLQSRIPVPVINGVRETASHLKERGVRRAGIMATDGTIRSGIFRKELEGQGIEPVIPREEHQAAVMRLIFDDIKAGHPVDLEKFLAVARSLRDDGAEAVILGCTELSLIKRDYAIGPGFIDAMEVLAQQAVLRCGKPLKAEYRCLISR